MRRSGGRSAAHGGQRTETDGHRGTAAPGPRMGAVVPARSDAGCDGGGPAPVPPPRSGGEIVTASIDLPLGEVRRVDLLDAFPETKTILALQSVTFAIIGALAVWGWIYATRDRRLIGSDLDKEQIRVITSKTLPEPVTALITLPFAFVGSTAWNLSWLAAPVVVMLVVRRRRERAEEGA